MPLCRDCLWRPCQSGPFLMLSNPLCPPGAPKVKTKGCGKLAQSKSTSTRPLPAGRRSTAGASLPDSNACVLALALSSLLVSPGIWLGSPAAAQLPATLPDRSAGAFTGPSRWLLLLQRRHPSGKRDSSRPRSDPPSTAGGVRVGVGGGGRVPARNSREPPALTAPDPAQIPNSRVLGASPAGYRSPLPPQAR